MEYVFGFSALILFALGLLVYALFLRNFGLVAGVLITSLLHFGVLFGLNQHAPPPPPQKEEAPTIEVIEMPPLPPEDIVQDEPTETSEAPPEFAPPMQADLPSVVTVDSFVQPLQPPPPPNTAPSAGALTIPVNRNISQGRIANLFNIEDLDQVPTPTYQVQPVYPYEMQRAGQNGSVTLGFIVDTNGNVRDVYVVRSSHPEFEQPAIQAVQRWRFRPGRKNGRAVNTRMIQPLSFKLND